MYVLYIIYTYIWLYTHDKSWMVWGDLIFKTSSVQKLALSTEMLLTKGYKPASLQLKDASPRPAGVLHLNPFGRSNRMNGCIRGSEVGLFLKANC